MIIENAVKKDAKEILDLQKFAYQSEAKRYNDYTIPPLMQTVGEIHTDFEKQIIIKASNNGIITGSVRAFMREGTCFIGRLIVHPDSQDQGIGTRLMHHIEGLFENAERFELFTGDQSEEALHLYNKLGYTTYNSKDLKTHMLVFLEKKVN